MRNYILLLTLFLLINCSSYRSVRFETGENKYVLNLPAGFKIKKMTDDEGIKEHLFVYPDSSIFYITDDSDSGGAVNEFKVQKFGDGIFIKILTSDTLTVEGVVNGKYWKELKQGDIVLGYLKVSSDMKELFDQALNSLIKK